MLVISYFRKLIVVGTFFSSSLLSAATLTSTVLSNTCSLDNSIKVALNGTSNGVSSYSAYSERAFLLENKSCEVKMRLNVPANSKVGFDSLFSRGKVTAFGSTAQVVYGMSVRTADDKNYMGGSRAFASTTPYGIVNNFKRGNGTPCSTRNQSLDIIIRHDGTSTQPLNTDLKTEYFSFALRLEKC